MKDVIENFNKLALEIHQNSRQLGWWDAHNICLHTAWQLVSTDIAEATKGARRGLMDDNLPHRKMLEVKLADTLIKVLDLVGLYIHVRKGKALSFENKEPYVKLLSKARLDAVSDNIVPKLFILNQNVISQLCGTLLPNEPRNFASMALCDFLILLDIISQTEGLDIEGAMYEKIEYNRGHREKGDWYC